MREQVPTTAQIEAMTARQYATYENNNLRRAAKRQGVELQKSRVRDRWANDYGTYRLVNPHNNTVVAHAGWTDYGLDLEHIHAELLKGRRGKH